MVESQCSASRILGLDVVLTGVVNVVEKLIFERRVYLSKHLHHPLQQSHGQRFGTRPLTSLGVW